jgi:hypothetical protein
MAPTVSECAGAPWRERFAELSFSYRCWEIMQLAGASYTAVRQD